MKKKIIILGSDLGTIDIVIEAKKRGLYVIVTDLMITSPTKEIADEAWMISTTDIELLEKKCKENNVIAVMTGASDFNTTLARELCKKLNLPTHCKSDYAWKVARDKSEFKKICKEVGAPVAQDYYVSKNLSDDEIEKIKFPVVVKPVDSSGNRGVSYCNNKKELKKAYENVKSVSSNETIIIERKLSGPEWTVNYVLADGEINLLYLSRENHQPGELPNLYSLMNTSSYKLKQFLEEVNDKIIEVFKKAEFKDGIAWVEVMLDEDGHFYLIECGYRYGSDMSYTLYEKIFGFNAIKWMIDISLGISHEKSQLPKSLNSPYEGTSAAYHLFSTMDDKIIAFNGLDIIKNLSNVIVDIPKREGSNVKYHSCIGTIRIYGETCDKMIDTLKIINSVLEINNENGDNMFIRFTDYDSVKKEFELGLKDFDIM